MSEIAIGALPRLATLIRTLQDEAYRHGISTALARDGGLRSAAKQMHLFEQGRRCTEAGLWVPIDPVTRAGIVTNATPDKAPHCPHIDHDGSVGACAQDVWIIVDEKPALRPNDRGYGLYQTLGRIGEGLGLVWGGRFHSIADVDHFELADWRELAAEGA